MTCGLRRARPDQCRNGACCRNAKRNGYISRVAHDARACNFRDSSPRVEAEGSVGQVAGELILQSEFFFLEAVEKVFVGVASMLFFLDEGVKGLVLRFELLDH